METKKIAVACFIGGALCCAVALMFAPVFWWLGIIAGLAGGYISYEFREVRKTIPVALRAARKKSASGWESAIAKARTWLSKPHPLFYPVAIVAIPFYVWMLYRFVPLKEILSMPSIGIIVFSVFFVALLVAAFIELTLVITVPFLIFAFIGARVGERCYWWPLFMSNETEMEEDAQKLEKKGLQRRPLNYRNVARWTTKGLGLTVLFFMWTLWKYLAIGVWATLCFLGRFAWHLFKLIHSEKRVLCAIDGTIGGAISYIWLASTSMLFAQQVTLVVFGGLLGAAFGVANWEIVSKRILQVSANGT